MKGKKYFGLILSFVLSFTMAVPALAVETDEFGKIMPNDVLNAINGIQAASLSCENMDAGLNKVFMETSLGITIPKVDLGEIHVTVQLTDSPVDESIKDQLREHGYTDSEIADMDLGDYINISDTWQLSEKTINIAKELYPELADTDISTWTYGQYTDFKYNLSCRKNMPNQSIADEFAIRGITLEDANWLLKTYGTYENILAQSDEELKKAIEINYQFLIDNVETYAKSANRATPRPMDDSIYLKVEGFEGYEYWTDYVHVDAGTHDKNYRDIQESMVKKEVCALYGLSSVPSNNYLTNIYGAWSQSQYGAHEGLDFINPNGGYTPTIYNMVTGVVRPPDAGHSTHHLAIYDSGTNKTYSYLHMNKIDVDTGDSLSSLGIAVGQQGNKGNTTSASGGEGYHVHFEVHSGNTSELSGENDDDLDSISPYQMWNLY